MRGREGGGREGKRNCVTLPRCVSYEKTTVPGYACLAYLALACLARPARAWQARAGQAKARQARASQARPAQGHHAF